MSKQQQGKAYAQAGVDIDLADSLKSGLKRRLRKATRPEVLSGIGGFGGLFELAKGRYRKPVLVSSTDGVGTKLEVAFATGEHEGVGIDIVNHCLNDIAVVGAEPLFFLDYFAAGRLDPAVFHKVLGGMTRACTAANCALIGGETAQMPGFYRDNSYDIVGTIVGVAEKDRLLTGSAIRPGDRILGLASSGLHTNGYTLARRIIFKKLALKPKDPLPGSRVSVGTALLKPHTNYATLLNAALIEFNRGRRFAQRKENAIFGAAHITGGGFTGNIPRVLPDGCGAQIDTRAWPLLPVFKLLTEKGAVPFEELYEVFNMGIGLCLIVDRRKAEAIQAFCRTHKIKAYPIGEITEGKKRVKLL